MARHVTDEPPSPRCTAGSEIPEELDRIILRCLAKNPADRPHKAQELERQLASCAARIPWSQDEARRCWEQHQVDLTERETNDESGTRTTDIRLA